MAFWTQHGIGRGDTATALLAQAAQVLKDTLCSDHRMFDWLTPMDR
jgi:hypothetical protein